MVWKKSILSYSANLMMSPIEELTDLEAKGYFTLTLTPADADAPVSGQLVSETDETVTLKVGDEVRTLSKTDVKMQMTLVDYDDEETVGEYVSGTMDDDEIILIVEGIEETFDPFDYNSDTMTLASGKKLLVTSPMPENFPLLLSVLDMSNLLSFLSTLTGATAEAASESAAEGTPAGITHNTGCYDEYRPIPSLAKIASSRP